MQKSCFDKATDSSALEKWGMLECSDTKTGKTLVREKKNLDLLTFIKLY